MLRRLLTFPDARGQRWSILRPDYTRYRLLPTWMKVALLLYLVLIGVGFLALLGVIAVSFFLALTDPVNTGDLLEETLRWTRSFALFFAGAVFAFTLELRLLSGWSVRALIKRGHCPTCAYSLANLPPTDPITCPECGAAWHPVPSKPSSTN